MLTVNLVATTRATSMTTLTPYYAKYCVSGLTRRCPPDSDRRQALGPLIDWLQAEREL